jgi:chemotaxis protein MotB
MTRILILSVAVLSAACVTSGKYNTLRKECDEAKAAMTRDLGERDGRIKQLEGDLTGARGTIATKDEELRRAEGERGKLEADLAATVKDRSALKASVEEMQTALAETNKRKAEAEKRLAESRALLGKLRARIDSGKLKVKLVEGRMVLALASDVLFASGSADLSPEGLATINEVSSVLLTIADRKFQIEGHTDNVPIKTARFPSNWFLGSARAITIVNTMVAAGLNPSRLSGASFGEFRPVATNDNEQGRMSNRRIEIVIVPDLSMLPGFDELKKAVESS